MGEQVDPPHRPDLKKPEGPPAETSAGCKCAVYSECMRRGRMFSWCRVKDTEPCPIKDDYAPRDNAGSDHRLAGSGPPPFVWDYCRLPDKEDAPMETQLAPQA